MYTHEERMKAVNLYINSDLNERYVIRALGYPSPNALKSWYKEYTETGSLHSSRKTQLKYTEEDINKSIDYYSNNKTTLTQTCRALGYPTRGLLLRWIKERQPELLERRNSCTNNKHKIKYTEDQKFNAVEAMLVNGVPDYKVAAQYEVSRATLYNWKQKFLGRSIIMPKTSQPDDREKETSIANLKEEISDLKQQVFQLKMERDALEKATELLKKANGINLESLKNKEKAEVIDALREKYRLKDLLKLFSISKSSYFYCINSINNDKYKDICSEIKDIFYKNNSCYGYRRIHYCLKNKGITISEKVVRRLMRRENLVVYKAAKKRYNSYIGEISPDVPNIINRDFYASMSNEKWLTDITEFALPSGKVYLSPLIDCFDGLVISWTI